jgi:aspartate aminotransferase
MFDLTQSCSPLGTLQPSATLAISAKAKQMKADGVNVCSMTAGEPDFDTPFAIKEACIQAINEGKVRYLASSGLPELKTEIVKRFATNGILTKPENIVISTGAKFALFQAITCLCGVGDEVILFAPYWLSYAEMIKAAGATPVLVYTQSENNYAPQYADLSQAITPKTKLIIVNSPNNPTGAVYSGETLEMIAEIAVKHNIMVLSDEIYEKLIYNAAYKHISIASLNPQIAELTITVNGFSKAYAMTGWRLGYLTAPLWLARRIAALQSHATSNATSFVQYAGVAALQGAADNDVKKMLAAFAERRNLICKLLKEVPNLQFYEPAGAFYVLCNVSATGLSGEAFAAQVLEREKLAVIPCAAFGAPNCIRLSYACSNNNIIDAVKRLKNFCTK